MKEKELINKKAYGYKNLTGKGKYIVKLLNKSLIKLVRWLKDKNSKKKKTHNTTIISIKCTMRHQKHKMLSG